MQISFVVAWTVRSNCLTHIVVQCIACVRPYAGAVHSLSALSGSVALHVHCSFDCRQVFYVLISRTVVPLECTEVTPQPLYVLSYMGSPHCASPAGPKYNVACTKRVKRKGPCRAEL